MLVLNLLYIPTLYGNMAQVKLKKLDNSTE